MQPRFELIRGAEEARLLQLANREPENPFVTPAFVRGQSLLGFTPCLLGLWTADEMQTGCIGFFKKGRMTSSLDIRLLPDIAADSLFWLGLMRACKAIRVWDLTVCAVTHRPDPIPLLGPVTYEETGTEFFLRLGEKPDPTSLGSNHRRNLVKAEKSGLVLRRTSSPDAIATHVMLMNLSMERRHERGEDVAVNIRQTYYRQVLSSGAGEFFQAVHPDGSVLSSVFLLRAAAGSYYQSAGTSPQGMSLGASPFLIWRTAELLRHEGVTCFSLGGTPPENTGLQRFKSSFGGEAVPFQTRTFNLAHPFLRRLLQLLEEVRRHVRRA